MTARMVLPVVMVLVGIAIVLRTLQSGGGSQGLGILLGALFVAAGAGRLSLERRS